MSSTGLTPKKVWIVMSGMYDAVWIAGVYETIDAAIAANPVRQPRSVWSSPSAPGQRPRPVSWRERSGGWQEDADGRWTNGLDFGEYREAFEMEVEG